MSDRDNIVRLLARALQSESLAEIQLQMFERSFICPKCGSPIPEKPVCGERAVCHRPFPEPESVAARGV